MKITFVCEQQNIAIRGHHDSGKIILDDKEKIENYGNFRNIENCLCEDSSLKLFLESPCRIKYTNAISQNASFYACNSVLLNKTVGKVNNAKCFTVFTDETADIADAGQVRTMTYLEKLQQMEKHELFIF